MFGFQSFGGDRQGANDTGDNANDENGKQFLLDAINGFTVKSFDLETDFFVAVVVLDSPTTIIKIDYAGAGKKPLNLMSTPSCERLAVKCRRVTMSLDRGSLRLRVKCSFFSFSTV